MCACKRIRCRVPKKCLGKSVCPKSRRKQDGPLVPLLGAFNSLCGLCATKEVKGFMGKAPTVEVEKALKGVPKTDKQKVTALVAKINTHVDDIIKIRAKSN